MPFSIRLYPRESIRPVQSGACPPVSTLWATIVLPMLTKASAPARPPPSPVPSPSESAELWAIVRLFRLIAPASAVMPPPSVVAELPLIVLLVTSNVPSAMEMPPPRRAEFSLMVLSVTVPDPRREMPPPNPKPGTCAPNGKPALAMLPLTTHPLMVTLPSSKMPPPSSAAELLMKMLPVMVRKPPKLGSNGDQSRFPMKTPPPNAWETLSLTRLSDIVKGAPTAMPPPSTPAVFPLMVLPSTVREESGVGGTPMPPPLPPA